MTEISDTADLDVYLVVTARLYGGGTAEEAAKALRGWRTTFDLPGGREFEILDARPTAEVDPEADPVSAHLHTWTILATQEAPITGIAFGKPMPRTLVLATCKDCGEPASWLLDGTWTLEDLRGEGGQR